MGGYLGKLPELTNRRKKRELHHKQIVIISPLTCMPSGVLSMYNVFGSLKLSI